MKYKCRIKGYFPEPNAFGVQGVCPFWKKRKRRCRGGIVCSEAIKSKAWRERFKKCQN